MSRQFIHVVEGPPKVDPETKDEIKKLRARGFSRDGICRRLQLPPEVVEPVIGVRRFE
jgi:hypothetical protein